MWGTDDKGRSLGSFEGILSPRRAVMSVHRAPTVPLSYGCQSNLAYFLSLLYEMLIGFRGI